MSDDYRVTGAEDLLKLSRALKEAGRGPLRKELNKKLTAAVKPLIAETRERARTSLPHSGGLAGLVAKEPQRVQVRTGQKTAGVRLVVGKSKGAARAANAGSIRHPVFGNRRVFVDQAVPSGWFDGPCEAATPRVQQAVMDAMQQVVDDIVTGAH